MGFLFDAWNDARNGLCGNWDRANENTRNIFKEAAGVLGVSGLVGNAFTFGDTDAIGESLRDSKSTGVVTGATINNGFQKPVGMPDSDWHAMQEAQKSKVLDNGSQKPVGMPDSVWQLMQKSQSESKNESASVDNGSKLSDYDKTLMDKLFKNDSSDVDNGSKLSNYDKTLMDKLFKNDSSDVEFTESSTGDMEFGD